MKPVLIYALSILLTWAFSSVVFAQEAERVDFQVSLKSSYKTKCIERQGSLEFGSGTVKALAVKVNTCRKKIVEILYEERLPLALNEALEKSGDRNLPFSSIEPSLPRLEKMVAEVRGHKVKNVEAIATSVFRVAKNGKSVVKKLSKALQLEIKIISQEEEAELGYWSAISQKSSLSSQDVIIWDIGGGSMQMYAKKEKGAEIFEGDLASVTFKNEILKVLKFKKPSEVSSPNPLGTDKDSAVQLADNHALENVPKYFKSRGNKARWIGVGGVLAKSVQKQVNPKKEQFTLKQLQKKLDERAHLTDTQIESDYKETEISNLALVLGYMKALGIGKVETVQASLGQGLIIRSLRQAKKSK